MTHPADRDRPHEDLASLRTDYSAGALDDDVVQPDPWSQFRLWFAEAVAAPAVVEANAMVVATVSPEGVPSARTVLLKGLEPDVGLTFFTHTTSAKGHDLAHNPACALLFEWHAVQRQVRITGRAEPLQRVTVEAYFASRPRSARIGAWASRQSQPVASRAELEEAYAAALARFGAEEEDGEVPPPPGWGGYLVRPSAFEFWQGRPSRLHDRVRWRLREDAAPGAGGAAADPWLRERLAP